jgi:hypothetical protein
MQLGPKLHSPARLCWPSPPPVLSANVNLIPGYSKIILKFHFKILKIELERVFGVAFTSQQIFIYSSYTLKQFSKFENQRLKLNYLSSLG